jgi:hypothetical protein
MKLRHDFEANRASLVNRDLVLTLEACLGELLRNVLILKTLWNRHVLLLTLS